MSRAQHLLLIRALGEALEQLPEGSREALTVVDAMGDEVSALLSVVIADAEQLVDAPEDDNLGRQHSA